MNRRLSIRLPEGLAWGIEAVARRSGRTKSEIVRDALTKAGIRVPASRELQLEPLRRLAQVREGQDEAVDAAALVRESREGLDRRTETAAPIDAARCRGSREPATGRTTPGFQQTP